MATKWDVQRAVRSSTLPPPSRLIMHTLIAIADAGTAEIPPQHTPSLSVLSDETGLDRSTVSRHLNALEEGGWVGRDRPDPVASRVYGERTKYRLMVPAGFQPRLRRRAVQPDDLGAQHNQVGAQDNQPGRTVHPDLGAQDNTPSRTAHHSKTTTTDQLPTTSSSAKPPTAEEEPRADVERVCVHLADRIESNGSKRPTITAKWRDSARLLMDRDGRTEDQVHTAIDWCQDDEFWRANILSMPTLRAKYDQLRLAAQRARGAPPGTTPAAVAPSRNAQILARARARIQAGVQP